MTSGGLSAPRLRRVAAVGALVALFQAGLVTTWVEKPHAAGTGVYGTLRNLTLADIEGGHVSVVAINPNLAKVVKTIHPTTTKYSMKLGAGLFMVGIEGVDVPDARRYSHAFKLKRGERVRKDLPRGTQQSSTEASGNSSAVRSRMAASGAGNVVSVDNVTTQGLADIPDGSDLSAFILTDMFGGSRRRCGNDVTYTSEDSLEAARREVEFQKSHHVDPSTRVTPNFVKPTSQVTGTITYADGQVTISLTQTDLATGETRRTKSVSGPVESFLDLLQEIGEELGEEQCPFPERWTGTASGTINGTNEVFDLTFVLEHQGDGYYTVTSGTTNWKYDVTYDSGGGQTCHEFASGTYPTRGSLFLFDNEDPEYNILLGAGELAETTKECSGETERGYVWVINGGLTGEGPWSIGTTSLSGSRTYTHDCCPNVPVSWQWSLTAE